MSASDASEDYRLAIRSKLENSLSPDRLRRPLDADGRERWRELQAELEQVSAAEEALRGPYWAIRDEQARRSSERSAADWQEEHLPLLRGRKRAKEGVAQTKAKLAESQAEFDARLSQAEAEYRPLRARALELRNALRDLDPGRIASLKIIRELDQAQWGEVAAALATAEALSAEDLQRLAVEARRQQAAVSDSAARGLFTSTRRLMEDLDADVQRRELAAVAAWCERELRPELADLEEAGPSGPDVPTAGITPGLEIDR